MNYKKEIKRFKSRIEELEDISSLMADLEDKVAAIEREISEIDASLPLDEQVDAMPDGAEKEQLLQLFDLAREAYRIIDGILGEPEETEEGDLLIPEARGNGTLDPSLEEWLRRLPKSRKSNPS